MRAGFLIPFILAFAAGCVSPEEQARRAAELEAQRDAACRATGYQPGTEDYADCRAALAERAQEVARQRIEAMQRAMDQEIATPLSPIVPSRDMGDAMGNNMGMSNWRN